MVGVKVADQHGTRFGERDTRPGEVNGEGGSRVEKNGSVNEDGRVVRVRRKRRAGSKEDDFHGHDVIRVTGGLVCVQYIASMSTVEKVRLTQWSHGAG